MAKPPGTSGKAARPAAATPATPGDPEAIQPRDAALALAATRPEPVGVDVPADTRGRGGVRPAGKPDGQTDGKPARRATGKPVETLRLGNREFRVDPSRLNGRLLDILPDLPDIRDRIYQPHLRPLPASCRSEIRFPVRDQGKTQSCTGHALAHVVDFLLQSVGRPERVSARMLYEMAKRNDEWTGTAYEGSSVRGAVSGFFRNGVCSEASAPHDAPGEWALTRKMAVEARETRIGAYYRLQPDLSDYHAALAEIGIVFASAQIHEGWIKPKDGTIVPGGAGRGGHAFAIVGYDDTGFLVLNSWGESWGEGGVARWLYEDWAATLMDAWVLQLGVRAPAAFSAIPRAIPSGGGTPKVSAAPNRGDLVGHFINIDDGRYVTGGRYASPSEAEMRETVARLTDPEANKKQGYQHLVIYAHGGLNTLDDEANRIAAWKRRDLWGRNGLYNFHLMWGSGLLDEVLGPFSDTQSGRAAGAIGDVVFETGLFKALGSSAWRNMKQDAAAAFTESVGYDEAALSARPGAPGAAAGAYDGGYTGLRPLLQGLDRAEQPPVLHLVGHSAGAIMLGRLLQALGRFELRKLELGSIHLMAPACTTAFFDGFYGPYLRDQGARPLKDKVYLYNLTEAQELADHVGLRGPLGYGRSLLHLVSRAYEVTPGIPLARKVMPGTPLARKVTPGTPLAGMAIHRGELPKSPKLEIAYAPGELSGSRSHGGFDNDAATLTTIMGRILGKPPGKPPRPDELLGY